MDSDSEEEEEDEEEESIESEEVTEVVPVVTKPEPSKEELEDAFLDALLAEQQEEPTFEEDDVEEGNSRFGGNDEVWDCL